MSIQTKKIKNQSPVQPSLFEWLQKQTQTTIPMGNLDIDVELRAALSDDLRNAKDEMGRPISRYEVAARMSDFCGMEITASALYNWTAESHIENNFPLKRFPFFVNATGRQMTLFNLISRFIISKKIFLA